MSLQELVNALQAVEQLKQVYRQEGTSEGALVIVSKERSQAKNQRTLTGEIKKEKEKNKKVYNQITSNKATTLKGKKGEHFPPCKYHQKTNHLEVYCWLKNAQCKKYKQFGHI
jgi:hypothetical protein